MNLNISPMVFMSSNVSWVICLEHLAIFSVYSYILSLLN